MAADSNIEWTDAGLVESVWSCGCEYKANPVAQFSDKSVGWHKSLLGHPLPYILGSLGTVASSAGRDNVTLFSQPTFGHRNNVVPCCGNVSTVRASAFKGLQNHGLSQVWDWGNTAPPSGRPFLSALPKFWIAAVSLALTFIRMIFAQPSSFDGYPISAPPAPSEAMLEFFQAKRPWGPILGGNFARPTDIGAAVVARLIGAEITKWLLQSALGANLFPIWAALNPFGVFRPRILGAM